MILTPPKVNNLAPIKNHVGYLLVYSSGLPHHSQLLCDNRCLCSRLDLPIQLGLKRWNWPNLKQIKIRFWECYSTLAYPSIPLAVFFHFKMCCLVFLLSDSKCALWNAKNYLCFAATPRNGHRQYPPALRYSHSIYEDEDLRLSCLENLGCIDWKSTFNQGSS